MVVAVVVISWGVEPPEPVDSAAGAAESAAPPARRGREVSGLGCLRASRLLPLRESLDGVVAPLVIPDVVGMPLDQARGEIARNNARLHKRCRLDVAVEIQIGRIARGYERGLIVAGQHLSLIHI